MPSFLREILIGTCLLALAGSFVTAAAKDCPQKPERRNVALDDGGHLSFVLRPGDDPRLVLIPGSFNDRRQWDEVVPDLGCDLELVLVELRGHGQSWPPPADGSIEQFADDVLRVTESLGYQSFYVGGHSIGGMVAIEVGHQRPEAVLGIISLEGWTHHEVLRNAFANRTNDTLTPELNARRLAGRKRATGRWTDAQRKGFAQIWRRWDGEPFLRQTDIPVLEVYGDRGRAPAAREKLRLPDRENIQLRWIANASHSLPLEKPAEVARLMLEFIQANSAR